MRNTEYLDFKLTTKASKNNLIQIAYQLVNLTRDKKIHY